MRRWSRPWIRHPVGSVRLIFFDRNPADVLSIKHSRTASSFPRVHRDGATSTRLSLAVIGLLLQFLLLFLFFLHWFALICFSSVFQVQCPLVSTRTHSWNRTKKLKSSTKTNDTSPAEVFMYPMNGGSHHWLLGLLVYEEGVQLRNVHNGIVFVHGNVF